ncbi:hypothetical protein FOB41_15160 [Agrobacterium pusense]|uniref:Uncharacterized protein n=1 Tax=Agrobacterium pusense TaxID=648995 RepID=A0A6H0ZNP8_9HYPH|nr:hypothetical protein [Agrobacterium pusense]MBM7324136.1 hypothetical protein [Agrobacterium sp. S2]QIX22388.1 hypothetical protein FOB41_15160 [Agrobacterium pusense]
MSKPYHQRPADPALPSPRREPARLPDGYWNGEEKFHVWRTAGPDSIDRDRGVIREYEVFGLLDWHSGPRAAQLKLSRNWTLRLLLVDGKLMAEAEVLLYPHAAKLAGSEEAERGLVVTFPISKADEDSEVRKLKRFVLRLAPWAAKRLGPAFEAYLEEQGL